MLNKLICLICGHKWHLDPIFPKKRRKCGRCGKKQSWTFTWKVKDFYEGWK